jgi:hypothetical protein
MEGNKRPKNEKQFKNWIKSETGGRTYWFEVEGKWGWKAPYVKEVDAEENTLAFRQEIYDDLAF